MEKDNSECYKCRGDIYCEFCDRGYIESNTFHPYNSLCRNCLYRCVCYDCRSNYESSDESDD
jgi:hypothetical protein